mgnify:CR=1 FL=1
MRNLLKSMFLASLIITLTSCVTGSMVVSKGNVYSGMSKSELRGKLLRTYMGDDPFLPNEHRSSYDSGKKIEIIWGSSANVFYVFENVYTPITCGIILCNEGNGVLKSWYFSLDEAKSSLINKKKIVQKKQPKISVSSNSNIDYIKELNKLIDDLESGKITQKEFNTKKNMILK